MLSILLSLVAGALVSALFLVTHIVRSVGASVTPGVVAMVIAMVLLFMRAGRQLQALMQRVEKHLVGGRREMAVKELQGGLALGRWHPLLPSQLRSQLGILAYANGDLDEAAEQLDGASRWPWIARAYLGCVWFKKREGDRMKKAFDVAIKVGAKEGIAYTLYAYCLMARGEREAAMAVLEKGLKKLPGDHRLEANLELAKEGKKLKTAPYGEQWSRFLLDGAGPTAVAPGGREIPKFMRGHNPRPGFRQRPQKKR
jgi:tetratricopeptide (TPR) repeat protein